MFGQLICKPLMFAFVLLSFGPLFADEDSVKNTAPDAKNNAKKAAPAKSLSAERETAALEFAQQNHPEIVPLLQSLKKSSRKNYQAALVDLDRTIDRLTKIKEKNPDRYEFQLSDWKLTSRIRLLAARLAVEESSSDEAELRSAIEERLALRLNAQENERDRLQKRLEKLSKSIGELSTDKKATIEKEINQVRAQYTSKQVARKNAKPPTAPGQVDVKGDKE